MFHPLGMSKAHWGINVIVNSMCGLEVFLKKFECFLTGPSLIKIKLCLSTGVTAPKN